MDQHCLRIGIGTTKDDPRSNYYMSPFCHLEGKGFVRKENMGPTLTIDEVNLGDQVYTILGNPVINKIVALIPGIKSSQVIEALRKEISYEVRLQVKEVTLDMSPTMDCIVSELFPQAKRTLDRFHVTKNVLEDIQAVRMRIKTQIKDEELQKEDQCKIDRVKYIAKKLSNHETRLDCITRIRYQLFKRRKDWNTCQKKRWETIRQYREFDEICISYEMVEIFYSIYDTQMTPETAKPLWIHWLTHISQYGYIRELQNTGRMIQNHLAGILNYFHHRSSNAFAEGLHSRIRRLISNVRGFKDQRYMLYRIMTVFS